MNTIDWISLIVLAAGFYMSWNIGANDVSNAMGTSVGSKSLTLKKAVILAAILEFLGAFLIGGSVSETLQKGIIKLEFFEHAPQDLVIGMLSALIATSVWLQAASYFGWPVSTTHAIVGAILGFGWLIGGTSSIHWKEISSIASSWLLSPLMSGIFSFLAFSFLQRTILFSFQPIIATKKILPYLLAFVIFIFLLATTFDGLSNLNIELSSSFVFLISFIGSLIAFFIGKVIVYRHQHFHNVSTLDSQLPFQQYSLTKAIKHLNLLRQTLTEEQIKTLAISFESLQSLKNELNKKQSAQPIHQEFSTVEKLFSYLQVVSACFVAFAHGANDVANAIGPVASILEIIQHPYDFATHSNIPHWLLLLGGVGIVIGLATWGWRVIETIGKKITELTPTRGFCAEFGAAITILIASKLGFPISTTHCIVGSVLGVGMAKGIMAINLKVLKEIVLSWIITIPCSAVCSIFFYFLIKAFLGPISIF